MNDKVADTLLCGLGVFLVLSAVAIAGWVGPWALWITVPMAGVGGWLAVHAFREMNK